MKKCEQLQSNLQILRLALPQHSELFRQISEKLSEVKEESRVEKSDVFVQIASGKDSYYRLNDKVFKITRVDVENHQIPHGTIITIINNL